MNVQVTTYLIDTGTSARKTLNYPIHYISLIYKRLVATITAIRCKRTNMSLNLKDKVVIVTGASSGIGATTATIFAREGANVVITGRNEANLNAVAEKCAKIGKKALAIKADVTKDNEAARVINKTIEKFGKVDVLVNNAGILRCSSILDTDVVAVFDEVMNTNLRSVVVLISQAAPHLIKTKGNIINVSSIAGSKQNPTHSAYCTSKAALNHFTRVIALELSGNGVRVNTVSPGPVETPIFETAGSGLSWDDLKAHTALGKITQPEEVGELIVYLASDKAGSITGSDYVIDCGCLIK